MVFWLANKIIERTQYTTLIAAVISGARPAITAAVGACADAASGLIRRSHLR
jgi:hypothetical protein